MTLRDVHVSNRNKQVYDAVKASLDEEVLYFHEVEVVLSDDEEGLFGNQCRRLADVIDAHGGNTRAFRQASGWEEPGDGCPWSASTHRQERHL